MKMLLEKTRITPEMLEYCHGDDESAASKLSAVDWGSAAGQTLVQLMKRPEVTVEQLVPILQELAPEFFARKSSVPSAPLWLSFLQKSETS